MSDMSAPRGAPAAGSVRDPTATVLQLVATLRAEMHSGQAPAQRPIRLDSSLERELGFDSLMRAELLLRAGAAFEVEFADAVLAEVETPGDLLKAVFNAAKSSQGEAPVTAGTPSVSTASDTGSTVPGAAKTLVDVLRWHAQAHPEQEHILFYTSVERTESISFGGLLTAAQAVAQGLCRAGLQRGEAVAIMLPTGLAFFHAFYGTLLAGGVPVALYPPARMSQIEDHLRRQGGILDSCLAPILITVPEARQLARLLQLQLGSLRRIVTVAELMAGALAAPADVLQLPPPPEAGDSALLQYTSGSTGNPKGVIVSHANLLANISAWTQAAALRPSDVCVSWLPLYHDMGLIGACFGSLYSGCRLVLMSPLTFLAHPEHWLRCISRHRGTIAAAPNFAYELCLRQAARDLPAGLDLSSWRLAANGAEPVRADTIERFCTTFAPYGFAPGSLVSMYGLAEATLGVAIPPPGRPARIDAVQRLALREQGRAVPVVSGVSAADANQSASQRFVSCGRVLPGHELRIVDEDDRELPERQVGHIQLRGPSVTSGYFRNPAQTRQLFHGGWLDSGDLGYLADAELYVTGRAKDMIIRGGRNLYPDQLEDAIGQLDGVRRGCVAVFAAADAALGSERLVAVVETRTLASTAIELALHQQINDLAVDILGVPLDDIVLAPARSVLKTSSGKLRRAATRDAYLSGTLCAAQRAPWHQIIRLVATALVASVKRQLRRLAAFAYGAWCWALLLTMALPVWPAVVLTRRPAQAWGLCHRAARLLLWLSGTRLTIRGAEQLPTQEPCVLVLNHASYLDGFVLAAALARPCRFVAKRELGEQFIAGHFLRALGVEFVERFDVRGSVDAARHAADLAQGELPMIFFPEGTLTRVSGLRRFHLGAFVAATSAAIPVVPMALRGTRAMLRDETWWPRRAAIHLSIGAPVKVAGTGWSAALALHNAARAYILAHCGEADLG